MLLFHVIAYFCFGYEWFLVLLDKIHQRVYQETEIKQGGQYRSYDSSVGATIRV